jgi:hypothetical protein
MARIAAGKVVRTVGLHRVIVDAVEEHFAAWDAGGKPRHYLTDELLPDPYPYQRLLDAARAGAPVNVALSALPADVALSAPRRRVRGRLTGDLPPRRPARAIVAPDDSVTFVDGELRLWMEEEGSSTTTALGRDSSELAKGESRREVMI